MKKQLILFILIMAGVNFATGQNFWRPADEEVLMVTRDIDREVFPEKYSVMQIDLDGLVAYLKDAPVQFNKAGNSLPLYIPMPDNTFMLFDVVNSPCMMPGLAKKFPQIMSFKGVSRENPAINIRFDIGEYGFHGFIYWKGNNIYIDPYTNDIKDYNISYFTRDYKVDISGINLTCGTDAEPSSVFSADYDASELELRDDFDGNCAPVKQYNYRLALGCTGEWGRSRGTVEKAMSDINTSVNRINQIYENEFSIHMNLIDNNDKIIWLDPATDPFEKAYEGHGLLGEVADVYNRILSYRSFDIGHIFTGTCTDVGGVASLSSVCNDFIKAQGVTCHYSTNLNYIITNVTCHEMGHQFSAIHTYNKCRSFDPSYGVEPGGGTTIMAYCGLCGDDNVDYPCLETFHSFSIYQIREFSRNATHCAEKITTDNTEPVAILDYKNGFFIPKSTPFYLEGKGFDCEDDHLTYSWEEMDSGPPSDVGNPVGNAPLFTAREPMDEPVRFFPDLYKILYNRSDNSEVLPSYGRDLNFRFIVRDNHPGGGGTGWADLSFKVDSASGPFRVIYPNSPLTFEEGTPLEVKWDVANTDNANVNCKNVDIEMSLDRGYNYDYLLKYHTPNDGNETVYLPDSISHRARLRIKASNNIFFDVADYNLTLAQRKDTSFSFETYNFSGELCLPMDVAGVMKTKAFNGYDDSLRFEIKGLPPKVTYSFSPEKIKAGDSTFLQFDLTNADTAGYFVLNVMAISTAGDTVVRNIDWQLHSNSYRDLDIVYPVPGTSGIPLNPVFEWAKPLGVDYVNIYVSKNPAFPEGETVKQEQIKENTFKPDQVLDYSSVYYWKLEFVNTCGTISFDTIYTFGTVTLDCIDYSNDNQVYIETYKTVSSELEVDKDLTISYLTVHMKGLHNYFKEIKAYIVSPDTTKVLLFGYKPFNYSGVFDLVFDNEAPFTIKSPPKGTFKPEGDFSVFYGRKAKGTWKLEITDRKNSNNNGLLKYFGLHLCGPITPSKPLLQNNKLLKIPLNAVWNIPPENLKAVDNTVSPDKLVFTLVKPPAKTKIIINGTVLKTGDTFTQKDIDEGKVKLLYEGDDIITDMFYFTVINGQGGWIDITPFIFQTDPTIDIVEENIEDIVNVYPNPVSGYITIDITTGGNFNVAIYNMEGKKYLSASMQGTSKKRFDTSGLSPGVYLLKVYNEKHNYYMKIIKQ